MGTCWGQFQLSTTAVDRLVFNSEITGPISNTNAVKLLHTRTNWRFNTHGTSRCIASKTKALRSFVTTVTLRNSVTFRKTWIFMNTAVPTSNIAVFQFIPNVRYNETGSNCWGRYRYFYNTRFKSKIYEYKPTLWPTQPPVQWTPGLFPRGGGDSGRGV